MFKTNQQRKISRLESKIKALDEIMIVKDTELKKLRSVILSGTQKKEKEVVLPFFKRDKQRSF